MSITDELRKFAWKECPSKFLERVIGIADDIDQGHKNAVMGAMNDALYYANDESMAELGWVRLPEDAEGVPFRVGDHVEVPDGLPSEGKPWQAGTITRLDLGATCWHVRVIAGGMGHVYLTENVRHYHAPTVEDVLRECIANVCRSNAQLYQQGCSPLTMEDIDEELDEYINEYAARLRLAGEDA